MSDPSKLTPEELARQAHHHLDSLRQAGIEWQPKGLPLKALPVAPPPTTSAASGPSPSLFNEVINTGSVADSPGPSQGTGLTLEDRRKALQVVAATVSTCMRCPSLASTRTQTVFGVGPPGVELCFVGEAPGADEDAQGEPFVGAAGQLLNRIIAACGLKREEVYICNIIKCRPPGNRPPQATEAANCRDYLEQQLDLVRPRYICALGGTAAQNLLGTTALLGQLRRRLHQYKGIPVVCTYHPAYLLPHRSPDKKKDVWEDMKMLMAHMGRPIAPKR